MRALRVAFAIVTLVYLSCSSHSEPKISNPKLVLLIVADQFPQNYFERFEHLLNGGLKYLREKGVVYTEAKFAHALTNTCPGHASLVSGSHPKTHGIVDNYWFDRKAKTTIYCAADSSSRLTPENYRVTTFADWLSKRYPKSKTYALSAKDRSAVMLGGKSANGAYWFNARNGKFISSSFYSNASPWWLRNFNAAREVDSLFGTLWTPLEVKQADLEKAQVTTLSRGLFPQNFPHPLGKARLLTHDDFYDAISRSPFVDDLTTAVAKQLILAESLGVDDSPDFLAISYSALDRVGHIFGPNSPEVADTLLRLDRNLQELFAFIEEQIGLENVLIAFSADHGVQPLPEYRSLRGASANRLSARQIACVQRITSKLSKTFVTKDLFDEDLYLNQEHLKDFGVSRRDLDEKFSHAAASCGIVKRVWSSRELSDPSPEVEKFGRQFVLNYDKERSPDYMLQLKPYFLPEMGSGTGHGSQYSYDAHVPMILVHPDLEPQLIDGPAQPVDLAPTLATLLGLKQPKTVEGRSWHEVLLR